LRKCPAPIARPAKDGMFFCPRMARMNTNFFLSTNGTNCHDFFCPRMARIAMNFFCPRMPRIFTIFFLSTNGANFHELFLSTNSTDFYEFCEFSLALCPLIPLEMSRSVEMVTPHTQRNTFRQIAPLGAQNDQMALSKRHREKEAHIFLCIYHCTFRKVLVSSLRPADINPSAETRRPAEPIFALRPRRIMYDFP
jgi:hypothetical protein